MTELSLYWHGPRSMKEETPIEFEGKSGLFAITCESKMIYIGLAGSGNTVFRESKRIGKCAILLQKNGVLPVSWSYDNAWVYAETNCERFVGVVSQEVQRSNELNWLLRNGENLLIHEINKAKQEQAEKNLPTELFTVYWILNDEKVDEAEDKARSLKYAFEAYPYWNSSEEHERKLKQELLKVFTKSKLSVKKSVELTNRIIAVLKSA